MQRFQSKPHFYDILFDSVKFNQGFKIYILLFNFTA